MSDATAAAASAPPIHIHFHLELQLDGLSRTVQQGLQALAGAAASAAPPEEPPAPVPPPATREEAFATGASRDRRLPSRRTRLLHTPLRAASRAAASSSEESVHPLRDLPSELNRIFRSTMPSAVSTYHTIMEAGWRDLMSPSSDEVRTQPAHALVRAHLPRVSRLLAANEHHETCTICQDHGEDADMWTQLSPCGHRFHWQCAQTWLESHKTCPLCRCVVHVNTDDMTTRQLLQIAEQLDIHQHCIERDDLKALIHQAILASYDDSQ